MSNWWETEEQISSDSATNASYWESVANHHAATEYYSTADKRAGVCTLNSVERTEFLPLIPGRQIAHLQCGQGRESVSLQAAGANVFGIDFSEDALKSARRLASELGQSVDFIAADILRLENSNPSLTGRFDWCYASHGVFRWIPSLDRWFAAASSLLRPGGRLYVFEIHPIVYRIETLGPPLTLTSDIGEIRREKQIKSDHAGPLPEGASGRVVHFDWRMADYMEAISNAGLRLHWFREHPICSYGRKGMFRQVGPNEFVADSLDRFFPLSFSMMMERSIPKK